jgi:DNA repair exonuclease SbcCD ATPase subunit
LKLIQVTLDGALDLAGTIAFPKDKVVVLYGANQQGKTNMINAIRYAFLKEEKGKRKSKLRYDDWTIPSSQEISPASRNARIQIIFEMNNVRYKLSREISRRGKDSAVLLKLDEQHNTEERIDMASFLKENLKAGLLDALFAPEIAGGFKRLYGRDLDESIALMFKEITAARQLSSRFVERLGRIQKAANAELSRINSEYTTYMTEILAKCDNLRKMPEHAALSPYQAGKTVSKIEVLATAVRAKVAGLKQDELLRTVETMVDKTTMLEVLNENLRRCKEIEDSVRELNQLISDKESLHKYVETLSQVTSFEDEIKEPPKILSSDICQKTKLVFNQFKTAKSFHEEAKCKADEFHVNLENVEETISEYNAVMKVLRQKQKAGEEKEATVTKIGQKAYTVIPIHILTEDPAFTLLNKQPIPKGAENEKKEYLRQQTERVGQLKNIESEEKKAQQLLEAFLKKSRPNLSVLEEQLGEKSEKLRKNIDAWQLELTNNISAYTGEKHETPKKIERIEEIGPIRKNVEQEVIKKTVEYLSNLNERVNQIGFTLKSFDKHLVQELLAELKKERLQLPEYEQVIEFLEKTKESWRGNDEVYADCSEMPKISEQASSVFRIFLENCIDEQELKEAIVVTFNEIINEMRERKLIEAFPEIAARSLQVKVRYKDKEITHPAGSEKAFFSLAILTALGHYFQMPILIDEVANNLDQRNLPSFFNMVLEQKSRRGIQYLLSIKQTRDFDLEGWVKDMANELEIYELEGKNIQRMAFV